MYNTENPLSAPEKYGRCAVLPATACNASVVSSSPQVVVWRERLAVMATHNQPCHRQIRTQYLSVRLSNDRTHSAAWLKAIDVASQSNFRWNDWQVEHEVRGGKRPYCHCVHHRWNSCHRGGNPTINHLSCDAAKLNGTWRSGR